jgi:flagellar basal-body rod protein FlgB
MFDRIETLRMASSLTAHAAERQKLIAQNVANADTPGFRARDLAGFAETYRSRVSAEMRGTRPGHLTGAAGAAPSVSRMRAASPRRTAIPSRWRRR